MRGGKAGVVAAALLLATSAGAETTIGADERAALRTEIERLKTQIIALEARLDRVDPPATGRPQIVTTSAPQPQSPVSIVWKGSPQFAQDDRRFKVKGRIQFDAGYLSTPGPLQERATGTLDRARGFSAEARRIRLGAEGNLGGGFGYKLETELSDNAVDLVDTYISYQHDRWLVLLGNHNSFQSFDELVGDTSGSFMERAAFTDAFGFERRLGLSAQWQAGPWLLQGGLYSDDARALANASDGVAGGDENNSFAVDGRTVFAPKLGNGRLHFAASYHVREFQRLEDGTQRYEQRPYLHSVNSRFLAVAVRGSGERHYGVEAAGVFGPLHYVAEAHWLRVRRPDLTDPRFFGAYAEVGLFLTRGDTRPYMNGTMGAASPVRPLDKGGPGAVQVNLRYDYLDMNDAGIVGGRQKAGIAAIIWTPVQFARLNLNYAHLSYMDAAILAGGRGNYEADVVGARAELDF